METGESRTPASGGPNLSGEEIRRASFPQALRGYDREAVHDLLDRVADWVEGTAGAVASATPGMREELAKVGERTAGILTAAEEAASNLRQEAKEYAERIRADAEDESREARLNASQRMDEMVAEAETKAQRIIDDAMARRRQLNQAISSLVERRDEIAADAAKLAEELLHAVEELRVPDPRDDDAGVEEDSGEILVAEESSDELAVEAEPSEELAVEPASGEETPDRASDPEFDQTAVIEPDEFQGPSKLLVDPDEETPPRGVPR